MPRDPDVGPSASQSGRSSFVLALLLGLVLGIVAIGSVGWVMLSRTSGRALLSRAWSAVTGRTLSIDVSQPTVVDRIQRLQRLEPTDRAVANLQAGAEETLS